MAYRSHHRLDGQELPRNPQPGDRCALCGAEDGAGSWLSWQPTDGTFLCDECR